MILLVSLALAEVFLLMCTKQLKKHPAPFYATAALASAVMSGLYWSSPDGIPSQALRQAPIWLGAFGTACFIKVMIVGALPNGSGEVKRIMPIRGELSIFACLITLGHNLSYGKNYLTLGFLFSGTVSTTKIAVWCSAVMDASADGNFR